MGIRLWVALATLWTNVAVAEPTAVWMELKAKDKYERTALIEMGYDIIAVEESRVVVLGTLEQLQKASEMGLVLEKYTPGFSPFDFPVKDEKFHNFKELTEEIQQIATDHANLVTLSSIGQTAEKRDLWMLRVSAAPSGAKVPATFFVGGHHAREHVSVEIPLRLLNYLVNEYNNKNPRIVSLLEHNEVFIMPTANPDGKEYDIASGNYRYWRKNRTTNKDGSYGVDLNRNYGFGWGGAGASASTKDETYRGPAAFSELETQAIKKFIEDHSHISMLLSYHTFSKLVLWPWGHIDDDIANAKDLKVFKTMGAKMAEWTGYKAMKSGDLYLASGDTCDWAYGERGIFAFTFELDPDQGFWGGGFYPGQGILDGVFEKNLEPALYMIETAANPYQVLAE